MKHTYVDDQKFKNTISTRQIVSTIKEQEQTNHKYNIEDILLHL